MNYFESLRENIEKEATFLIGKFAMVVIIGVNDLSMFFADKISKLPGFIGIIPDEGEVLSKEQRCYQMEYEDLVRLRDANLRIYNMTKNGKDRVNSRLRDVGITQGIYRLGYGALPIQSGSRMIDTYDPLLGKTRIDEDGNPELVIFSGEKQEGGQAEGLPLRILILGGSTSDPYYGNMKSWPEYLYEKLSTMRIRCEVIAAGMATYDSFRELKKLIRDGVLLNPDIVISYSGFNEGLYNISEYPFSLKGDEIIAEHIVNNHIAKHDTGAGIFDLKHVSMGMKDKRTVFRRWYDNERIMHGICSGLGVSFIAALQPVKHTKHNESLPLYREAALFFQKHETPSWMRDMTSIFDNMQDVYADSCHVYEEGNRKIAQFFLREVLEIIKERGGDE